MKEYFNYNEIGGISNRYCKVVATAKCARLVTDEYVSQRENAEKLIANKETERPLASLIKKEVRDDKAVITAIERLRSGEYRVVKDPLGENTPENA